MSMTGIILAAVIVGGTGLFIGIFLGLADKQFAVEVDEKEEQILGVLNFFIDTESYQEGDDEIFLQPEHFDTKLIDEVYAEVYGE